MSEDFEVQSEVQQGCMLSPLLFLVIITDFLRAARTSESRGMRWTIPSFLKHLDYVDHICYLYSVMNLHQMVHSVSHIPLLK